MVNIYSELASKVRLSGALHRPQMVNIYSEMASKVRLSGALHRPQMVNIYSEMASKVRLSGAIQTSPPNWNSSQCIYILGISYWVLY
jgi:ribosomal protein L20A (L18A)